MASTSIILHILENLWIYWGVQSHPGDAKCVTEILPGNKKVREGIIKIVATMQMSHFKAKMLYAPNSISAGSLPQTPLGELTVLPQLDLRGPTSKGREGKGWGD